jgi:hypothetical protein
MEKINTQSDFCIEIDFKKESEAPSRVFRTLSDLIDAFHAFDLDLVQSIDSKIEPIVLLEDVEAGSIKTWLRNALSTIDDEALKKLDWKTAVGAYLVRAKYLLIKFIDGKTEITDRLQIEDLTKNIFQLAQETDVRHIPTYLPLSPQKLLENLDRITSATQNLIEGDKVRYLTREDEAIPFNLSFRFIPEAIEDLITKETIESKVEMILKVKKPDYLGDSKWEFKHENKIIPIKVLDVNWLTDFQNRKIDVRPGDSIRAKVQIIVKYDYDLNVISTHYNISEIVDVIPGNSQKQNPLF